LKLNGTYQLLVYADVNILGGSVLTIEKNTEALVVGSKESGLEINADKTKCLVMSRDQTAGCSYNIKIDNSSFERMEEFKYLGTTLKLNSVALVRTRTIPTERPPPVGEVSANFCG